MCNARWLAGLALWTALLLVTYAPAQAQEPKPLAEADLIKRIEVPLDDDVMLYELQKKGLSFFPDDAALERLKKAGASPAVLVTLQKVRAPGRTTTSDEVKALAEKLASKDPNVRKASAAALGKLKEKVAVEALCEALADRDVSVRATAAASLQEIRDPAAVPALVKRVTDDVWVNTLANVGGNGDSSKDAALAALKELDPDKITGTLRSATRGKNEQVRWWACAALGALVDDKDAVKALVEALRDRVPAVRDMAAASLGKLQDRDATVALCEALTDREVSVRTTAAASLQKIDDKSAVPALVKRVADDVWSNTLAPYGGNGDSSKDAALVALKELNRDKLTGALRSASKGKNEQVRWWACAALAAQVDDKDAVQALVDALGDRVPLVRQTAAASLGKLQDREATPALARVLTDKDVSVRTTAAASLQKVDDKSAVPALAKRVADDVWSNTLAPYGGNGDSSKDAALAALKELNADKLTGALQGALKADEERVRWWACGALAAQVDDKDALHALVDALGDKSPLVRQAAADSLGKLQDREATTALVKSLADKDVTVRATAAASLQKLDDKSAVPALVKRVADDIWVNTLANIGGNGDSSKEAALAALKELDKSKVAGALEAALQSTSADVKTWAAAQLAALKDKK